MLLFSSLACSLKFQFFNRFKQSETVGRGAETFYSSDSDNDFFVEILNLVLYLDE